MKKQWKVGLSVVALAAGLLTQAYAADQSDTNSNMNMSDKSGAMMKADKMSMVDINTATAAQLEKVKGLDKKEAKEIVAYRMKNGNFTKVEDLMKVKGIDKESFDKIKSQVMVGQGQ